jgi:hypothetical protein
VEIIDECKKEPNIMNEDKVHRISNIFIFLYVPHTSSSHTEQLTSHIYKFWK